MNSLELLQMDLTNDLEGAFCRWLGFEMLAPTWCLTDILENIQSYEHH
jgi:hypothetical protein